jgi:tripartite-type tricarboxylate transporter receptor subunit TctC
MTFMQKILRALVILGVLTTLCARSTAEDWPARPVKIVLAFSPGGAIDLAARELARKLSESFGQSFYVENRVGAGGSIGTEYAAKAAPDGYTFLFGSDIQFAIAPHLDSHLPYSVSDFAPVSMVSNIVIILAAHPSLRANNVAELIALAKQQPAKINYGSIGPGTMSALAMDLLQQRGDFKMTEIPYRGAAEALPDLLSGQIQVMPVGIAERLPYLRSGQLKALGVLTSQRFDGAPDIPTIAEQGFPGYEVNSFVAIYAPVGTPAEIIAKLQRRIALILGTREMRDRFLAMGAIAMSSTPDALASYMQQESDEWARVIHDMRERERR